MEHIMEADNERDLTPDDQGMTRVVGLGQHPADRLTVEEVQAVRDRANAQARAAWVTPDGERPGIGPAMSIDQQKAQMRAEIVAAAEARVQAAMDKAQVKSPAKKTSNVVGQVLEQAQVRSLVADHDSALEDWQDKHEAAKAALVERQAAGDAFERAKAREVLARLDEREAWAVLEAAEAALDRGQK